MRARVVAVSVVLGLAVSGRPAHARMARAIPYDFEQTWQAMIRVLRVDLGYDLAERDREAGFVLFRYVERGRLVSGSIELTRAAPGVRVVVTIPTMPAYVESAILTRLERKLGEDFGPPPAPRAQPAPAAPIPTTAGTGTADAGVGG